MIRHAFIEGRGIGLHNKIKAYSLQESGMDTVEANHTLGFDADMRHYDIGGQILKVDLGVTRLRLLTNNPRKVVEISGFGGGPAAARGIEIVERVPVEVSVNDPLPGIGPDWSGGELGGQNREYMLTKKLRMGHILGNC